MIISNCIILTGWIYLVALLIYDMYFNQCFGGCRYCKYLQMTEDGNWADGCACNECEVHLIYDICYEEHQAMEERINSRIAELKGE